MGLLRLICLAAVCMNAVSALAAASGELLKVLPHYLDKEGRNSVSPSLYDRDAYQAMLRQNPQWITALRYDVHWKLKGTATGPLKLRFEFRGTSAHALEPLVLEKEVEKPRWKRRWSSLTLDRAAMDKLGEVASWRATLWDGDRLLAEEKSFLW
jgi:hypothetical protein